VKQLTDSDFKIVSDKLISKCSPAFSLYEAQIEGPQGTFTRQYIHHNPVVAVYIKNKGKVLITSEFRIGVKGVSKGIPAGYMEEGETPEEAAIREVQEETGIVLSKNNLVSLGSYRSSEGFTDEVVHLFIVDTGDSSLSNKGTHFDSDEMVSYNWVKESNEIDEIYDSGLGFPLASGLLWSAINNA
jgi:8-oxo-dGTP pyrophosphatase MutT (NUDIX family)